MQGFLAVGITCYEILKVDIKMTLSFKLGI